MRTFFQICSKSAKKQKFMFIFVSRADTIICIHGTNTHKHSQERQTNVPSLSKYNQKTFFHTYKRKILKIIVDVCMCVCTKCIFITFFLQTTHQKMHLLYSDDASWIFIFASFALIYVCVHQNLHI